MRKETLKQVRDEIIKYLNSVNIDGDTHNLEKIELMINIERFLDPNQYEETIKSLQKIKK